jgi:hypothetical protein
MGSMTRRLRRNITAANMAANSQIRMPPIRAQRPDGTTFLLHSKFVPMCFYRAPMLRLLNFTRRVSNARHDQQQRQQALREKRVRKIEKEGNMIRRFFKRLGRGR